MRIAIIVVIVLIIVGLATWFGIYAHTTPATTITSTVTRSIVKTRIMTTTVSITVAQPTTITVTSPVVVTEKVLTTVPITITKPITYTLTTTIENEKTITKTITTTETLTTTSIETKTVTETNTITKTIIKNVTITRTIEKSIVLDVIPLNDTMVRLNRSYAKEIGKEIAMWILKANHSVYGVLGINILGEPVAEQMLSAFKEIEKRGVNITLVGENGVDPRLAYNMTLLKMFCKWIKGSYFAGFSEENNIVAIDNEIVIVLQEGYVVVLKNSEFAKTVKLSVEYLIRWSHGVKPPFCPLIPSHGS